MTDKLRDEAFAKRIVESYPNLPPDERALFTFCRSFLALLRENGELRYALIEAKTFIDERFEHVDEDDDPGTDDILNTINRVLP